MEMQMNDLSRLEGEAWERGYACGKQEAAARIKQLEAALAEWKALAIQWAKDHDQLCEDEGCPNAGTPHVCINRQENDDVFKGFRGNNEA
jgi:hypothetical protein